MGLIYVKLINAVTTKEKIQLNLEALLVRKKELVKYYARHW